MQSALAYKEQALHRLASLGEIVIFDSCSDELGFCVRVLWISYRLSYSPQDVKLTMAAGGLTYLRTVRSFLLRI